MGYDLHITRATDWTKAQANQIRAQEWLDVLAEDTELEPAPDWGPYSAHLSTRDPEHDPQEWFDWYGGNIFTTNPSRSVLAKMLEIARKLDARVQGDQGEWYHSAEQIPLAD